MHADGNHEAAAGPAGEQVNGGVDRAAPKQHRGILLPDGFGPALRVVREDRGLTRRRLAELAQIDPSTITRLERGERGPSREAVDRLARALQAAPEDQNHLLANAGFLTEEAATLLDEPDLVRLSAVLADPRLTPEDRRTLLTYVRLAVVHAEARGYGAKKPEAGNEARAAKRPARGVRRVLQRDRMRTARPSP